VRKWRRATQLGEDCERVGVAFIELCQSQVVRGNLSERAPTLHRLAIAWHRKVIETQANELPQPCAQLFGGDRRRTLLREMMRD
jgi:hypothetical protein